MAEIELRSLPLPFRTLIPHRSSTLVIVLPPKAPSLNIIILGIMGFNISVWVGTQTFSPQHSAKYIFSGKNQNTEAGRQNYSALTLSASRPAPSPQRRQRSWREGIKREERNTVVSPYLWGIHSKTPSGCL